MNKLVRNYISQFNARYDELKIRLDIVARTEYPTLMYVFEPLIPII